MVPNMMERDQETNSGDQRFVNTLNSDRKRRKELFFRENLPGYETAVSSKRKRSEEWLQIDKRLKSNGEIKESRNESIRTSLPRKSKSLTSCALGNTFSYDEDDNCSFCRQPKKEAELCRFYISDFLRAQKEKAILKSEDLHIFQGDEKAQVKLTSYCVYDEEGHLCPFVNGFVEEGVVLHAAGYVKPIHSENTDVAGGLPVRKIGPIISWWITGFDGGEKAILGISTDVADYYLLKPSKKYEPFLQDVNQKMFMVKVVIEFLKETEECESTYENLLNKLKITVPPTGFNSLSEENLLVYADFIYDLVMSYDSTADSVDRVFVNTQCMKHLAELAGISIKERLSRVNHSKKTSWIKRNNTMTKAATTNLVENIFESLFHEQMDKSYNEASTLKECYVLLDKYECDSILNKSNHESVCNQGADKSTNEDLTALRECVIELEKIEDQSYEDNISRSFSIVLEKLTIDDVEKYLHQYKSNAGTTTSRKTKRRYGLRGGLSCEVYTSWSDEPVNVEKNRSYHKSVTISNFKVNVGDFVLVDNNRDTSNHQIGRIIYMWEEDNEKKCHLHWFINSLNTILGETGNPREIFETQDCENVFIDEITDRVEATYLPIPSATWLTLGNYLLNKWNEKADLKNEKIFFFQKRYNPNFGRFEDVENSYDENEFSQNCPNCDRCRIKQQSEKPVVGEKLEFIPSTKEYSYRLVRWKNEELRVGSCVFLKPGTLFPKLNKSYGEAVKLNDVDEERYPEMYRKTADRIRFKEEVEPFNIGYIASIHAKSGFHSAKDILLTVKKFYRPQNTHLDENLTKNLDLNLLYWSDEESEISLKKVKGKCYVANEKNLQSSAFEWSNEGPHRFYYKEAYDYKNKKFVCAPTTITRKNETATTRRKSDAVEKIIEELPPSWPTVPRPLRSLDIFAGCGGLTEGLHQAGVADCRWAIEKEETAAHAFRLNYPRASVFSEDCNDLLKSIMSGETKKNGQTLPQKGDVEFLCGGPPCQGFSHMNRFNDRQYSCFKNSLVVSFLSYVDYFRPRYVIMENVRNFIKFEKSMVLKLTIRCLVKMGYQCTFGIVQAGHYGVPQSRRRAIILAAAPNEILPNYPDPITSFNDDLSSLFIDDVKYTTNVNWTSTAPLRTLTVADAIDDLPEISGSDSSELEVSYTNEPKTHFQRMMRKARGTGEEILRDHITKPMKPIVEKRISFIPRVPDSDWRDLPNIVVELADGSRTKKLKYTHHDIKNGKSSNGALRGVCSCASGKKCRSEFRQTDTLIPWCLPHTANRHNNWAGLYGRIEWNTHFRTVVTNIDPMGKQGKIVHPEQDRVISVREAARSQGFPDRFRFFGNAGDKYRQIGNAVPPPLAAALGREIIKAMAAVEERRDDREILLKD